MASTRESEQRRFFRQSTAVGLTWGSTEEDALLDRMARVVDISGNGLSMEGEGVPPARGDWIALRLHIPGRPELVLVGEVTREITHSGEGPFSVAVEFKGITENECDEIVEFVTKEQTRKFRQYKAQAGR